MQTVYRNGAYRVILMATVFAVTDASGKVLHPSNTIEDAIEVADEMALGLELRKAA